MPTVPHQKGSGKSGQGFLPGEELMASGTDRGNWLHPISASFKQMISKNGKYTRNKYPLNWEGIYAEIVYYFINSENMLNSLGHLLTLFLTSPTTEKFV